MAIRIEPRYYGKLTLVKKKPVALFLLAGICLENNLLGSHVGEIVISAWVLFKKRLIAAQDSLTPEQPAKADECLPT
jgi:hypothetical protein